MSHVSKKRSLVHSIGWNLAGAGVPLVFAFFAVPHLLSGFGSERFGFLTITWALIGYFSIFDFGIGRALTKAVSDRLGDGREDEIPSISITALSIMLLLGLMAATLMIAFSNHLAGFLKLDVDLVDEGVHSIRVLAIGIPFVIMSAGLIGLLEAHSEFQSINSIRLVMGLLNFAAPMATLHWSSSLVPATISLAVARIITSGLYLLVSRRLNVLKIRDSKFNWLHGRELISFGSWITVSNLVSPLMAQLDKVVIGGVITLTLLPFYSIPSDLVNRLSFGPIAVIGVFFPLFASSWASSRRSSVHSIFSDAAKVMGAAMVPISVTLYAMAPEGLGIWMGTDFSSHSAPMLRCLCIGLLANSIARVPHALIQAIGKPDITAKVHLIELPIYAIALWLLLRNFGVAGAAIAWSARMILDLMLLSLGASLSMPDLIKPTRKILTLFALGSLAMIAVGVIPSMSVRLFICIAIVCAGAAISLNTLNRIKHHD